MHSILVSVIPRTTRTGVATTRAAQASTYFGALRTQSGTAKWTDFVERDHQIGGSTYPTLSFKEALPGPLEALNRTMDGVFLLYFPSDFPAGGYFYVFFRTDTHPAAEPASAITDLELIVTSFSVTGNPETTASRGCV